MDGHVLVRLFLNSLHFQILTPKLLNNLTLTYEAALCRLIKLSLSQKSFVILVKESLLNINNKAEHKKLHF